MPDFTAVWYAKSNMPVVCSNTLLKVKEKKHESGNFFLDYGCSQIKCSMRGAKIVMVLHV